MRPCRPLCSLFLFLEFAASAARALSARTCDKPNATPLELYDAARKSLHFVGYEGMSMIAASGVDMAAWDALAKAVNLPLCVLLGGSAATDYG